MKTVMKLMLGAAVLITVGSLAAQEMTMNKAADWKKNRFISDGEGVLNVESQTMMTSSKRFEIDPEKTYTIKFSVRAPEVKGKSASLIFAGFAVYDKNGRLITQSNCDAIPDTLTEVVSDAKKGDAVLIIKDGSHFKKANDVIAVAGAKEDLSDLPNFNILATGIKSVEKHDNVWKITVNKPLTKDVKAGTSVRLHRAGAYLYAAGRKAVGKDWVTMSGSTKGIKTDSWKNSFWPPRAEKAEFIILANWNKEKTPVQFKDLSLTVE